MYRQTIVKERIHSPVTANVEGFNSLAKLAIDLRSSWNHATDEVCRQLDLTLCGMTQNPSVVLQTVSQTVSQKVSQVVLQAVSKDKLKTVLADPAFREPVDDHLSAQRQAAESSAWFQKKHSQSSLKCVVNFATDYTAQIISWHDTVVIPLEDKPILWQR